MRLSTILFPLLFASVSLFSSSAAAQSSNDPFEFSPELRSVGLSMGTFSPSFNYLNDRTFWDFGTGAGISLDTELSLMPVLGFKLGFGFFQTNSDVRRGEFAQLETLEYTFVPLTLALVGRYTFSNVVTASISPAIDLYSIDSEYSGSSGVQSAKGSATGFSITGGLEREFGPIGVELFGKYAMGSFDQEFQFGQGLPVTTEEISIDGFNMGLTLKYMIHTPLFGGN